MSELIERQAVIDLWDKYHPTIAVDAMQYDAELRQLPLARSTQLTHDDMETIRVHLSAIKENLCNQHRWNEAKEYEALIDRLSAHPEPNYNEWCTDCKEYDKEKHSCPRWNRVIRQTLQNAQPEPCEDAVSRKVVIDTIDEWKEACADSGHKEAVSDIMLIRKDFIELPSVTPKQRTGKWIRNGWAITCSECGYDMPYTVRNFCPHCGAKMEGAAE